MAQSISARRRCAVAPFSLPTAATSTAVQRPFVLVEEEAAVDMVEVEVAGHAKQTEHQTCASQRIVVK